MGSDETYSVTHEIDRENKSRKEEKKYFSALQIASQLGFVLVIPLAGGALLGQFLDKKFGTSPKMTLSLIVFGLIVSLYSLYKIIKEISE